jgi:NADPH:quinone reductase-like Zn-dependent oxidoreductase
VRLRPLHPGLRWHRANRAINRLPPHLGRSSSSALFFLVNVTTAHLTQIAAMIDAGDLAVNVGTILPLADARVAHEMLEGLRSRPRGKIVLSVGE